MHLSAVGADMHLRSQAVGPPGEPSRADANPRGDQVQSPGPQREDADSRKAVSATEAIRHQSNQNTRNIYNKCSFAKRSRRLDVRDGYLRWISEYEL